MQLNRHEEIDVHFGGEKCVLGKFMIWKHRNKSQNRLKREEMENSFNGWKMKIKKLKS